MAANTICHIEFSSINVRKAAEYYNKLFGWQLNSDMGDEYVVFQPESGLGGGIQQVDKMSPGGGIVFYVHVADIEEFLKKAIELGGKQVVGKTEIPHIGWFAHFTDPDGNLMGLFSQK